MQAMPETVPSTLPPTLQFLARRWWLVLLRGVVAILFRIPGRAVARPDHPDAGGALQALAFTDGILALAAAVAGRGPVLSALVAGAVRPAGDRGRRRRGDLAGAVAFALLLILIAATAIALGAVQIHGIAAIQMRKEIAHEWLLILAGVVSILFGIVLLAQPGAGAIAIAWMVAPTRDPAPPASSTSRECRTACGNGTTPRRAPRRLSGAHGEPAARAIRSCAATEAAITAGALPAIQASRSGRPGGRSPAGRARACGRGSRSAARFRWPSRSSRHRRNRRGQAPAPRWHSRGRADGSSPRRGHHPGPCRSRSPARC